MLSNAERNFVRQGISENLRVDKRSCRQFRETKISYNRTRGCCSVELGQTKVLGQVSWDVMAPKDSRPNEGFLNIGVEMPPFISGKATTSELSLLTSICVERSLRDSKCIDLESLCIQSAFKVFSIKLDLHVLNYDGNHIDALVLCGMAALKHFRRPDVTYAGIETIIHSEDEKDPLALTILHVPISTTLALFTEDSKVVLVADPTEEEEKACDSRIMVVANKHDELCYIRTIGCQTSVTQEIISKCCRFAVERAKEMSEKIEKALIEDTEARDSVKSYKGVCMVMQDESTPQVVQIDAELKKIKDKSTKIKT